MADSERFFDEHAEAFVAFIHLVAELLRETTAETAGGPEIAEIADRIPVLADRLLADSQPNPLSDQDKLFVVHLCVALETILDPSKRLDVVSRRH